MTETEAEASKAGRPDPYAGIKFFRKSARTIGNWTTGYEVLTRTPEEAGSHAHQDFWSKFVGVPHDRFRPYVDIKMKTGVEGNAAGAVKPTLTDEEAIALWDKLTSSIRERPTIDTKTSDTTSPRIPLGYVELTGSVCPESGWWECARKSLPMQGGEYRFFQAGDVMPETVLLGRRSLWQKLRGVELKYRMSSVWKLIQYETPEDPAEANLAEHTSTPPRVRIDDGSKS